MQSDTVESRKEDSTPQSQAATGHMHINLLITSIKVITQQTCVLRTSNRNTETTPIMLQQARSLWYELEHQEPRTQLQETSLSLEAVVTSGTEEQWDMEDLRTSHQAMISSWVSSCQPHARQTAQDHPEFSLKQVYLLNKIRNFHKSLF